MANWFKTSFTIYKKVDSAQWTSEKFVKAGASKGFIQPVSAALGTTSGKVSGNSTHRLYCPHNLSIWEGDKIEDDAGHSFIVTASQHIGIAGILDHAEVEMVLQ